MARLSIYLLPTSVWRMALTAWFMADTICEGVALGATIEYQPTDSKPGKPASCKVGTLGSFSSRVVLVTASARSVPSKRRSERQGDVVDGRADLPPNRIGNRLPAAIVGDMGHLRAR
jgi:hypothetical protein